MSKSAAIFNSASGPAARRPASTGAGAVGECRGQGRVCAGAGGWCGWNEGISWLLLSPRSLSPAAAEGGSARAEQGGRGDVSRLMAAHPLPAARREGREVSDTVCVHEHLHFCAWLFWQPAKLDSCFSYFKRQEARSYKLPGKTK